MLLHKAEECALNGQAHGSRAFGKAGCRKTENPVRNAPLQMRNKTAIIQEKRGDGYA